MSSHIDGASDHVYVFTEIWGTHSKVRSSVIERWDAKIACGVFNDVFGFDWPRYSVCKPEALCQLTIGIVTHTNNASTHQQFRVATKVFVVS